MKHLLHILLVAVLLTLLAGGCRRSPGEAERRLIAIDSLISAHPDSALTLLAEVDTAALGEPDRAYHALLTVQANYVAYIPANDSTTIVGVWHYYRDHGPYDRQIRAMRYRATTAEEMGDPIEAMRWYKQTELTAREHHDDFNTGYALMSMGVMYQESAQFSQAISKYRIADSLLDAIDTESALFAKHQLAQCYMSPQSSNGDSANHYIQLSEQIASRRQDTAMMAFAEMLRVEKLFYDSCFDACLNNAIAAIQNYGELNSSICWYMASQSLAMTGRADSAEALLNQAPAPLTKFDSIEYNHSLSLIYEARGEWQLAQAHEAKSQDISSDYLLSSLSSKLSDTENLVEQAFLNQKATLSAKSKSTKRIVLLCVALAIVLITSLWLLHHYRLYMKKHLDRIKWLTGVNEKLSRNLTKTQKSIDEKEKEISQVRQNLRKLESASSDAAIRMKSIEEKLKQKEEDICILTEKLSKTEDKIDCLASEMLLKQEHIDTISRRKDKTAQALHSTQAELVNAKKAVLAVKAERDKAMAQKAQIQENLQRVEATVLSLSRQNSDIKFIQTLYAHMSSFFAKWIEDFAGMANDYYIYENNADQFVKRFKKYLDQNTDDIDFWQQIESYIDISYNGALSLFRKNHPKIPTIELKLLMLSVLGFDISATAICLGLRNVNVVYSLRSRLKKRLHCTSSPETYLLSFAKSKETLEK